ncbi:hypothetical protein [Shouchella patagoniensis]|uniref:hypothetical protein n=1 Tax=Shouchella patagoniensis TaxID=228576 RepID=UPI0015D5B74B|nr:hypothetical protein [Shouchella patagoniensis]
MSWGKDSYGCGCDNSYNYSNNNNNKHYSSDCDCDSFFKHISRGEDVKVILKGGDFVKGSFVNVKRNVVEIAKAECHEKHDECKCKKHKVRITTICCDDIVAVEV